MRFVPSENSMGQHCIYMDMQGLLLGTRDEYVPGALTLTDTEFGKLMEHAEVFKFFRVDTYNVLKPNSSSYNWNHVFGPVNEFLRTLTDDEKRIIAETLIIMHFDIVDRMRGGGVQLGDSLVGLTRHLGELIDMMDRQVDLCTKIEMFIDRGDVIVVPEFDNVGNRPQDTKPMTFFKPEVKILTVFAVLNKLLCPILGVFIEHCKKQIDNSLKELHAVDMLNQVLSRKYPVIVDKLRKYIRNIIKPNIKEVMKYIVNGCTLELESQKNYANILVRKLVSMNLCREGGNLMTYITASVRECTRTPAFVSVSRGAVEELKDPSSNANVSTGEEGNISALESGSRSSDRTVDYPILIDVAAMLFVENMIKEEEIDKDAFEECVEFYHANIFQISPVNSFLLAVSYGYDLGGAKAIRVLNAEAYIRLITLLQFQCMKRQYFSLIPILSLMTTGDRKNIPTKEDNLLKTAWNASYEYINCKAKFNHIVGNLEWDTCIRSLVDFLLDNVLITNIPFYINEYLKWENTNNKIYQYPNDIIRDICRYVHETLIGAQEEYLL